MRVRHSPWSWLNEIVPLDSVAGNTLTGMFTRLTFRKPFHVARAAINVLNRDRRSLAVELDGALADFVPKQPSCGAIFNARDDQPSCKIAQPCDDHERDAVLSLAP